jgi:Regulator of chromosome condensation (RCC1) repeat
MTVLPIVQRELRAAARQGSTYWVRLGLALAAIFVGAVIFVLTFGLPPAQTGRYIFEGLAGIMLVYCLSYGRRSTADCLSLEKREGTLGLLFLTDLKGHDVVLGKLVATSVRGFYGLLAVFPVLAVPLLLGGITNGEFWRVVLVLMDTFLFSLAIGILGSAISRDLRRAMAANFLLLLLLMAVPAACMLALRYFVPGRQPILELLFSCPLFSFYLCDETQYQSAWNYFWWSVAVIHGLTWLLVLAAGWIVPRSWQDRPSRTRKSRLTELWHAWRHGPVPGKRAFRRRSLDQNAFYWLAARERFKPVHVWTFLVCMTVWWLVGWLLSGRLWLDPSVAVLTALLLNSTLKIWLAIEAGQQLAEDQRTGAFELLLSVPLAVEDIVRGQLLALRRQFLRPLLSVLGVELLFMLVARRRVSDWESQAIWLAGMFMLVADLLALSWVAMWRALVARTHNLATISTVVRVLGLPWLLFGAVVGFGKGWYSLALGEDWSPSWQFRLALWLGFGLAVDFVFGLTAWWQLRTRFRELALRRFNPVPSRFARWFGLQQTEHPSPQPSEAATQTQPLDEPHRRAEGKQDKRSGISALIAPLRLTKPSGKPRARLVLAGCLALVVICFCFTVLRSRSNSAPAIVVSLNQSNGPVRVCAGPGGVLMILPDGSLWRWGRMGPAAQSRSGIPEQVGTNCDWVQAAAGYSHLAGVRRDGTLWEWRGRGAGYGEPLGPGIEPRLVDSNRDWVGIAVTTAHSVALRGDGTLWAWGDNSNGQLGIGPGPNQTKPVQVGTNNDWAALWCPWSGTLALRRDGTLWAWGPVYVVGTWGTAVNKLTLPTRVCLESNWTSFITWGYLPLVRNRLGEVWEPFHAAPNPEGSAASVSRLVATNAFPGRFATAWCGEPRIYEVRSDGTLWERTQPLGTYAAMPVGNWRRVRKRSDWTALWGTGNTAIGLTGDGTLWTWGIDPGGNPPSDFLSRLKLARTRLMSLFGPGPRPMAVGATPVYQEQPRPLMRLVLSKSLLPARARDGVGR